MVVHEQFLDPAAGPGLAARMSNAGYLSRGIERRGPGKDSGAEICEPPPEKCHRRPTTASIGIIQMCVTVSLHLRATLFRVPL